MAVATTAKRYYSVRLTGEDRRLLIAVCRALSTVRGPCVRDVVRELLYAARDGRVGTYDVSGRRLMLDDKLRGWASAHVDHWLEKGTDERYLDWIAKDTFGWERDGTGGLTLYENLCDPTPLTTPVFHDSVGEQVMDVVPAGEEGVSRSDRAGDPPLSQTLARAPVIPSTQPESGISRATMIWETSHEWWARGNKRTCRNRRVELDQALARVASISERRGWVRPPLGEVMQRVLADMKEGLGEGEEAVVGYCSRTRQYYLMADQFWRKTSSKPLYLVRRGGMALPEEVCVLMDHPPEHPALDRLSEVLSASQVVNLQSQGWHGATTGWVAGFLTRAAEFLGVPVTAEFHGGGVNTIGMVLDQELGAVGWEYSLLVEGNPFVRQVSATAWGDRVKTHRDRVEDMPPVPRCRRLVSFLTYRCQQWSYLDFLGLDKLEDALAERAAGYRSVAAGGSPVIVDEMLARQHMAGRRLSWYRVEYLRELYFPLHDWYICDTDPIAAYKSWMRSHREIVIGVTLELKPLLENYLREGGWRKLTRADYAPYFV